MGWDNNTVSSQRGRAGGERGSVIVRLFFYGEASDLNKASSVSKDLKLGSHSAALKIKLKCE